MLGKNLRQLREAHGYTQETLAKISGVGEKYISAIESGKRDAGKHTIARLCDALMVDEMTLRFGERTPPVENLPIETKLLMEEISHLPLTKQLEWLVRIRKAEEDHSPTED